MIIHYGQRTTHNGRPSFTLVELLVVIAIIAILFSLTSAAVIKVIGVADDTANRVDISHLEVSVEAFKNHYGVKYIPSRIWLDENLQYTTPPTNLPPGTPPAVLNQLRDDSKTYLKQLWPNLRFPGEAGYTWIDWDGSNDRPSLARANVVLEGHQCLVFFLGGIPSGGAPGTTGFSTNKRNPAWHSDPRNSQEVVQPFYEFKSNRLVLMNSNQHRFYSYLDTFGRADGNGGRIKGAPYAYFTSYKSGNDYNRYGSSDNPSLGVAPYHEPVSGTGGSPRFHNATGFQIISAGLDGQFGPGGPWAPSTAGGIAQPGRDDHSNFYDRKLGVSQ